MLHACMLSWKGNWKDHLALAEFSYNNSYHASIKMAPYESLYGRKCISPLCWEVASERLLVGPDWIQQIHDKVHQMWHPDSRLNRIDRILIPPRYTFFSKSPTAMNSRVKCAWPRAISEWVTDRKVFPGVHKWGQKCTEKIRVGLWG
jgi:hypothetical protein